MVNGVKCIISDMPTVTVKLPDLAADKFAVLASKLSLSQVVDIFGHAEGAVPAQGSVPEQVLGFLSSADIASIDSKDLPRILLKPEASIDGQPNPEYQVWIRLVAKYSLAIGRVRRGLGDAERYAKGRGANRGKQRIDALAAELAVVKDCLSRLQDRIGNVLSEGSGE